MVDSCYHCSEPVPSRNAEVAQLTLLEEGIKRRFCCAGCKAVYQFINSGGLTKYYARREKPATRLDEFNVDYTAFDTLLEDSDFVRVVENDATAKLLISEMHCSACVWLLETVIQQLPGINFVKVNLQQRYLQVSWNINRQKLSYIMQVIQQLGYKPEPWTHLARVEQHRAEKSYLLRRLGVASLLMMQIGMLSIGLYAGEWQGMQSPIRDLLRAASALLAGIAILYCAMPFFNSAWRSAKNRRVNMDVPVSLALMVAYITSIYASLSGAADVYFDTVAMFICFLLLSRFIETCSREPDASTNSTLLPLTADRRTSKGIETVPLAQLKKGDTLRCTKGQRVVADGILLPDSSGYFDESAFTGESMPQQRMPGEKLLAGAINTGEAVWYELQAVGKQSSMHKVEQLVEDASLNKPEFAALIDRVSPWFVMLILVVASVTLLGWLMVDPAKALLSSLAVLVVGCPCALSLATPTALAAAHRYLRKKGVLPLTGRLLEHLPDLTHIIFDKTGTLTQGKIKLQKIVVCNEQYSQPELLKLAASLESYSDHPLAKAIVESYGGELLAASNSHVATGYGVEAIIAGRRYRIGSSAWCEAFCAELKASKPAVEQGSANMLLCDEHSILAEFYVQDNLRTDSVDVVKALKASGLQLSILSGDSAARVETLAHVLDIDHWQAAQSPADKLAYVKSLQALGYKVLMVGDGLNDSPVIAAADVSIAMCNASDLSQANADAVLLSDQLAGIVKTIGCALQTRRIVRQNIGWAIGYNSLAMPLAALGYLPPWLAALGMSISSLVVVFNSQRLSRDSRAKPRADTLPAGSVADPLTV